MARRIGRVILFVVLVFLLVLPICLIAHPISYVPLIACVLLICVSWLYLQSIRRNITVSVDTMETSCERGEKTALKVSLVNSASMPCARMQMDFFVTDLFGKYDDITTFSCALRAHEHTKASFDVLFTHLGTYQAGVSRVRVFDLLGLFSVDLSSVSRRQMIVRPRNVDMVSQGTLRVAADEKNNTMKAVLADDVDYATVREYRYGDPLKTLHWNLSARDPQHRLYTRLFETYVNPSLTIVIDPCTNTYDTETLMSLFDGMVEVAASLCVAARSAGIDACVRYLDRNYTPSVAQLASCADADDLVIRMMHITPVSEAPAAASAAEEMLRESGLHTNGSGNIALITSRPDAAQLSTLIEIAMNRRNAMEFFALPRFIAKKDRETILAPLHQLSAFGGRWWAVESNELATEVVGL